MKISQAYRNAFTEVYTILDYVEDDDYKKIPQDVLDVIKENRNFDYEYEMNEEEDIFKQPMLPETKAILFNFYRDYWCSPEQKEKIKMIQAKELQRDEERKRAKYNSIVFADKGLKQTKQVPNIETSKSIADEQALVERKEKSLFTKIINKIKSFFQSGK